MNAISGELDVAVDDDGDRLLPALDPARRRRDEHFLVVSRAATASGVCSPASSRDYAVNLGSLIEVVNRFGSFFYGSILGVFLLAMIPRANGARRVRRPDRRHAHGRRGELRRAGGVVPLAQRDRRGGRGGGRSRFSARWGRRRGAVAGGRRLS